MEKLDLSFSSDNSNLNILKDDENILLTEMYLVSTGDSRPVSLDGKACVTNFSLEAIKDAEKTLFNKPIVCVWNKWKADFKNHAVTTQDIQSRIAIGSIPESCEIEYKEVDDKVFLVCKVLFWKKYFPTEISKIALNTINGKPTNLSMEITVEKGHYTDEEKIHYMIDKFTFNGVSLLGEDISTGIVDAQMNTIKFSAIENLDDVIKETNMYFSKYEEEKGVQNKVELTKNQIREILGNALSEYKNKEGYTRFWVCDFDDNFVYVEDNEENYKTYKAQYTLNTEKKIATVDIENKKPVIRGGFVDVIEGETQATYEEALTSCKELKASCDELKASKEELETKCSELEASKTELEGKCSELETKCAEFSSLKEEKTTLETNYNSVNEELTKLKEETVVKYSRLVELEGMFAQQQKDDLISKAKTIITERQAYFSEEEQKDLMKEFEDKYLSSEGLVTFSTVVGAKAEPRIQAELNALREKLNNVKLSDESNIDFSTGSIVDNLNKQTSEDSNVWSRLGIKLNN